MAINNYLVSFATVLILVLIEILCGDASNTRLLSPRTGSSWSNTRDQSIALSYSDVPPPQQTKPSVSSTSSLQSVSSGISSQISPSTSNIPAPSPSTSTNSRLPTPNTASRPLPLPSPSTSSRSSFPVSSSSASGRPIASSTSNSRPSSPISSSVDGGRHIASSTSSRSSSAPPVSSNTASRPNIQPSSTTSGRPSYPSHTSAGGQRPILGASSRPASPQSWPRPPSNPQSILKPVSVSGNRPTSFSNVQSDQPAASTNDQQTSRKSDVEDNELRQFSETLLSKEVNSALKYIKVNYQGKTTSRSPNDEAPLPLIEFTNKTFQAPTINFLKPLYDNYILETKENEHVTPLEREEENRLIDAVVATPVMRLTRNFLIEKGKIGKDPKEFRDYLKLIWFTMYSRGKGKIGSSAFEHIFLTEIKNREVSGLHNWVYFQEEEAKGNANYLGYMKKIEYGNKGSILKFHFKYRNIDKPVGSMFIGTSPEFEMALYTTCFALRADKICPLQLDGNKFIIRTFSIKYRGKTTIGSAFPDI